MSVLGVVRQLRSPSVAVLALAVTASLPATASARSSVTIAGAPAKRLRMCGAVHKTLVVLGEPGVFHLGEGQMLRAEELGHRNREEVRGALKLMGQVGRIPRDEAMKMVKTHKAIYVDVRAKDQYDIEHIQGAINIPLAEITARASELPKHKFIVTYCA